MVDGPIETDGDFVKGKVDASVLGSGRAKVCVPDPITFAEACDDEHYHSREKLMFAYCDRVLRRTLKRLSAEGAAYVQLSAPGLVARFRAERVGKDELSAVGEGIRSAIRGVNLRTGYHTFFGDASPYLPLMFDALPTDDIGFDLTETDTESVEGDGEGGDCRRRQCAEQLRRDASRAGSPGRPAGRQVQESDVGTFSRPAVRPALGGRREAEVPITREEALGMTGVAFPTQEIGSLPKFGWRTKPFRSSVIDESDIAAARSWGERLRVPKYESLVKLLEKRTAFTGAERRRIVDFSILYAMAMQERAGEEVGVSPGLQLIWSGEQARTEMYETPVSNIEGFEFIGKVRSFDNKYWRIASIRKKPSFRSNYHLDEYLFVKDHTQRTIKVPVTDAITIMAWSDNFHYTRKWSKKSASPSLRSFSARREFTMDLAKVIRRVIRELISEGAVEVQIDIPAATQYQTVDDAKLVAEAFNETTSGLNATFSVHSCFPPRLGYALLFPYLLEMKKCARFSFEYANRDTYRRGLSPAARPGYSDLRLFREYGYGGELGVGVLHVHTDPAPSVGTVRDRILYRPKSPAWRPKRSLSRRTAGLGRGDLRSPTRCSDWWLRALRKRGRRYPRLDSAHDDHRQLPCLSHFRGHRVLPEDARQRRHRGARDPIPLEHRRDHP